MAVDVLQHALTCATEMTHINCVSWRLRKRSLSVSGLVKEKILFNQVGIQGN